MNDLWDKLERAYHVGIEAPGKETHFLILLSLVITFGIVRLITHAIRNDAWWWPGGNVETQSGLHIHHMVPGILLLMFSGYLGLSLESVSRATTQLAKNGVIKFQGAHIVRVLDPRELQRLIADS